MQDSLLYNWRSEDLLRHISLPVQRLRQECKTRPAICEHDEWFGTTADLYQIGDTDLERIIRAFNNTGRSYFCLQPPGDSYSRSVNDMFNFLRLLPIQIEDACRRAIYDCLALGAVPVVFEAKWLHTFPFNVRSCHLQVLQHVCGVSETVDWRRISCPQHRSSIILT